MIDLHVVGGGPSGSIAAINALKQGANVIISEEHSCSGIPQNCSGLFSDSGLKNLLSKYIDYKKTIINPIYGAKINCYGEHIEIRRKRPVAYACARSEIDKLLISKAEQEGAKINYNERISSNFYSKNIIGADGPHSTIAKKFNMGKLKYVYVLQGFVPYSSESKIVEIFLSEKFPGFFGWIIPHNEEYAEIGAGSINGVPKEGWEWLCKKTKSTKPKGWTIPIRIRPKTALSSSKNVILVGDAAGQVKASTGGGVILGGGCAEIAGKYFNNPKAYEKNWKKEYLLDFLFHQVIQQSFSFGIRELFLIVKYKKHYLERWGEMDRPTIMFKNMLREMLWKEKLNVTSTRN